MRIPLLKVLIVFSLFVFVSGCYEHSRPYGEVGPAPGYDQPAGTMGAAPSYDAPLPGAVGPAPGQHHRHYRTDDSQGYDVPPADASVGPAR